MLSYNDIISYKFEKAGFGGGYRPEDVDKFTMRVATDFQKLEAEKAEVEQKLMTLANKVEEYREDEESLRAALLGAQKLGDSIIRESKQKGEMMIAAARGEAQRVTDDIRHQIEREQGTLTKIQQEVSNFKNRLLLLYKQHLELISSIPGQDVPVDPQEIINASQNPQSAAEKVAKAQAGLHEQGAEQASQPEQEYEEPPERDEPDPEAPPEYQSKGEKPHEESLPSEQTAPTVDSARRVFSADMLPDDLPEDFSDVIEGRASRGAPASAPQRESKFGELRFGEGYDLRRNK